MAARAVVTINDGAATPVARNFSPNSGDGNVPGVSLIEYEDRSAGIEVGYPKINIATRKATRTNSNRKVTVSVNYPVLEVISNGNLAGYQAAPTPAYDLTFKGEFILPARAILQDRKHLLAFVKNLLAHAVITSAIQDNESPW